jgi:hypothetical protein
MNILCDNFLTCEIKKIAKSKKFLKKSEETLVEISAQSEHFYVLVVKGLIGYQHQLLGFQFGEIQVFGYLETILNINVVERNKSVTLVI